MGLLIEKTAFGATDITLKAGAKVFTYTNNSSIEQKVSMEIFLEDMDNVAASTISLLINNKLDSNDHFTGLDSKGTQKNTATTHFYIPPFDVTVEAGEIIELFVNSDNASDTVVTGIVKVVNERSGYDATLIAGAAPPSAPDNFSDMNINTDGEVDVTLRNNEQYGPLNT